MRETLKWNQAQTNKFNVIEYLHIHTMMRFTAYGCRCLMLCFCLQIKSFIIRVASAMLFHYFHWINHIFTRKSFTSFMRDVKILLNRFHSWFDLIFNCRILLNSLYCSHSSEVIISIKVLRNWENSFIVIFIFVSFFLCPLIDLVKYFGFIIWISFFHRWNEKCGTVFYLCAIISKYKNIFFKPLSILS